ncbi:MAG: hypothetical protein KGN76_05905, partial [Acidobacteriota bacterium]|nr:hypothetical protein [Acidobacteriota bacterium]
MPEPYTTTEAGTRAAARGTHWIRTIFDKARRSGADALLCPADRACDGCQALIRTLERTIPEIQAAAVAGERVRLIGRIEALVRKVEQGIEAADRQREWRARADGLAARAALV